MRWATKWGADTVRIFSTGKNIHETRDGLSEFAPSDRTVPIYQAWKSRRKAEELTWDIYRDSLDRTKCEQGVDYFPRLHTRRCPACTVAAHCQTYRNRPRAEVPSELRVLPHHQAVFSNPPFREICEVCALTM